MTGPRPSGGSIARRRLLVALGFGATNVAVLRRLGSGSTPEAEPQPTPQAAPQPVPATSASVTVVSEPEQPVEPPEAPMLDESAAMGTDQSFDLAIVGGRVIDPASGFDAVASVGISGSTVAAISVDPEAIPLAGSHDHRRGRPGGVARIHRHPVVQPERLRRVVQAGRRRDHEPRDARPRQPRHRLVRGPSRRQLTGALRGRLRQRLRAPSARPRALRHRDGRNSGGHAR